MRDVVVSSPIRTPVGRYGGIFKHLSASDLGSLTLHGLLDRAPGLRDKIDDVILGHANPNSEAPAIGRVVALNAGLPVSVPGSQVDRRCGSGLQAIIDAVMAVQTGVHDVVIAGGVESMSNAHHYTLDARWGDRSGRGLEIRDSLARSRVTAGGSKHLIAGGMIETAENLRSEYGISRREQDEFSFHSHKRSVEAQRRGWFDQEILPVPAADGTLISVDEHPRPDISLESLSRLRPILGTVDAEATVTAGNASGQNDAAALCVVTTPEIADEHKLAPRIALRSWATAGVAPERMGLGPVPASALAFSRAGLTLEDIDVIELNEAFAAQTLAVLDEWSLRGNNLDRLNPVGSGISLGHPVGATGARILTTLASQMTRQDAQFGLETLCVGGGQGIAAIWERVGA